MSDLLFMKLAGDSFKGEEPINDDCDTADHQGMMRINSFSHQISQDIAPIRPSAHKHSDTEKTILRKGEPQQGLFIVNRYFDKVSPELFAAASAGILFDWVAIYYCSLIKEGEEDVSTEPVWEIILKRSVIADFQYGYSADWPEETISFAFTSIVWRTHLPKAYDGSLSSAHGYIWNGTLNRVQKLADDIHYTGKDWEWPGM
jgi:type VI protein secretion system component Hcp